MANRLADLVNRHPGDGPWYHPLRSDANCWMNEFSRSTLKRDARPGNPISVGNNRRSLGGGRQWEAQALETFPITRAAVVPDRVADQVGAALVVVAPAAQIRVRHNLSAS